MTDTAAPFGLRPVASLAQGYNTQGFSTFDILDGYTTGIFFGDVVKLATTGVIQKDTGTTTLTPQGIFVGCRYKDPTLGYILDAQYWPASTTTGETGVLNPVGKVVNDPNAVFAIQADATVAKTALGANAAVVQGAGNTQFGISRVSLSASSINTTDTLPLRIVGLYDIPGNAWGDSYPILLCKFNNHQLTTLTGI